MMSHNVRPLIFYSDTRLMHLITKLKTVPPGPPFTISNNCSIPHNDFFGSLLQSISSTQKVIHRLLSSSSFSNLLECDSYLRRYFTYSTGLNSVMRCPRHYQPTLAACKAWALTNCKGISAHERMFLNGHSRRKRSSFMCHAGLLGVLRAIYISLGHSCKPNHISSLKDTLRSMSHSLGLSQSMLRVINGKFIYIMKTTDSMTTKINRLSQDLKLVDQTFTQWQSQLNRFAETNTCHDSILLEFLSKHSNAVNRAFAALLRLSEIQDTLHQFATLETRTLFGFSHLPAFLHPQILTRLSTDQSMTYTAKALDEGFPLFINPMVDIEHQGSHIEAGVLLTLPVIPDTNAFCTIEYLSPLKFNSSNICYTGPVTKENLVLLTCPNSKQIITTEALNKCYQNPTAIICPTNLLNTATNITWLGFPFTLDTKLTFPRNHVAAQDCSNLHPLLHLGGRAFLATTTMVLTLSSGPLVTAPLAVYQFPCNESFQGMATGLGHCSKHITVSVPMATTLHLRFTSWARVTLNSTMAFFKHAVFDIPPPEHLNKTILDSLDATFNTLDGQLTESIQTTSKKIDEIHESSTTSTTDYVAYSALSIGILNLVLCIVLFCLRSRKHAVNRCATCQRPQVGIPFPPAGPDQDPADV